MERNGRDMERRAGERFVVRQFNTDSAQEDPKRYRVLNISGSGCAVESRAFLEEKGGRVLLDVPLPSKTRSLTVAATVVWVERRGGDGWASPLRFGLRFEEMDRLSHLIMDAYLGFLRRDAHIAQLEEAWEKLKRVQERIEVMIACEERKEASYLH